MKRFIVRCLVLACACVIASPLAWAGGGPLGIDHKVGFDDHGIYKRSTQKDILAAVVLTSLGSAIWQGGQSRFGKTSWQSVDAMLFSDISAQVLKVTFSRSRPSQTDNPNQWFQGSGNYSFPSGEVTVMAAAVTPYVLEYHRQYPWVWALETLPAYDMVARVKTHGHWQSDVLAGFVLGTAWGYWAHARNLPVVLGILPHGFMLGLKVHF